MLVYLAVSLIALQSQADLRDIEPIRHPGTLITHNGPNCEALLPFSYHRALSSRGARCPSLSPSRHLLVPQCSYHQVDLVQTTGTD